MGDFDAVYEPVMPFVTVASKGGPYADDAYAAGWAMGQLSERLAAPWLRSHTELVRTLDLAQVDLLAMKHDFTTVTHQTEVDEWTYVVFTKECR